MKTFAELGLSKTVLDVLDDLKFAEPTEIQEKTIPLALAGKDIIGGSATGSGKTLAFASPILENLKPTGFVQALVLTPTRELAEQVSRAIEDFSKNKKLKVLPVYGGASISMQMKKLPRTDIVVGTPGRILDHMQRRTLKLDNVRILVLDEVDRMFDMGFCRDVETIIRACPKKRQTMMFSATISRDIDYLAKKHTNNAIEISVDSYVDPTKLKQVYYDVLPNLKFSLLIHLLIKEDSALVMVFCSTRRNVDFIARNLKNSGIHALAIHGGLAQNKRIRTLDEFHGEGVGVLVCTDVAARGLDIKGVSHIYNYDLPKGSLDYIHRIGRTARAGEEGKAINILSERDYDNFRSILRDESLDITKIEMPKVEIIRTSSNLGRERQRSFGKGRASRDSGRGERKSGGEKDDRPGRNRNGPRRGQRKSDGFRGSRGGRSSSGGSRGFGGRGRNSGGSSRGGRSSGGRGRSSGRNRR